MHEGKNGEIWGNLREKWEICGEKSENLEKKSKFFDPYVLVGPD